MDAFMERRSILQNDEQMRTLRTKIKTEQGSTDQNRKWATASITVLDGLMLEGGLGERADRVGEWVHYCLMLEERHETDFTKKMSAKIGSLKTIEKLLNAPENLLFGPEEIQLAQCYRARIKGTDHNGRLKLLSEAALCPGEDFYFSDAFFEAGVGAGSLAHHWARYTTTLAEELARRADDRAPLTPLTAARKQRELAQG